MRNQFIIHSTAVILVISGIAWFWLPILWIFVVIGPLVLMGIYDMFQTRHAIKRNFPLIGRGRYILENMGPKVNQYFIESDAEGRPFHRKFRSIIYQRAKQELDTQAFGTQIDVYKEGYEWMEHSINPLDGEKLDQSPRLTIGSRDYKHPYSASILNISAMSYGSLNKNAILALNAGARKGEFAHNSGEGGIRASIISDLVVNYHHGTVKTLVEMMAAAGLNSVEQIDRHHINRRVDLNHIVRYDQIFTPVESGCLLDPNTVPDSFKLRSCPKIT